MASSVLCLRGLSRVNLIKSVGVAVRFRSNIKNEDDWLKEYSKKLIEDAKSKNFLLILEKKNAEFKIFINMFLFLFLLLSY